MKDYSNLKLEKYKNLINLFSISLVLVSQKRVRKYREFDLVEGYVPKGKFGEG